MFVMAFATPYYASYLVITHTPLTSQKNSLPMKQQRDPLTAVLSVSMTVLPNCPCLYSHLYRCDVI